MSTGTIDPSFGLIASMVGTLLNSSAPRSQPTELPAWYVSFRTMMDNLMTQSTTSGIRSFIPLMASLLGITQEDMSRLIESVLSPEPRPRSTEPPPVVADAYTQFLSAIQQAQVNSRPPPAAERQDPMEVMRSVLARESQETPRWTEQEQEQAEMVARYPEALAEYEQALAEEAEKQDQPPEKRARHD